MACALSGNSYSICAAARGGSSRARMVLELDREKKYLQPPKKRVLLLHRFRVKASSDEGIDDDCNSEECAPDKEVGKVSMEWLAGEKTQVVGTFPPRTRGWTGYIEKDTAGQTNIYSVEPAVYIAESAISSGSAGSSAEGTGNTVAVVASIALVSIVAASAVLLQVGKNPAVVQTSEYSGPSLSYYINKFNPAEIIEAAAPPPAAESATTETSLLQPQIQEQLSRI